VNLAAGAQTAPAAPSICPGSRLLSGHLGPQEISIAFKGVDLARPSA